MGTEVLRPQDCLLRPSPAVRQPKPLRRRREGSPKQPAAKPSLTMGQVTILRRGESLSHSPKPKRGDRSPAASPPSPASGVGSDYWVFGVDRLGPDPSMIPKEIRLRPAPARSPKRQDMYAGTAFENSPSPQALPLPSFWRKEEEHCSGTVDLRRLLRLE